MWVDENAADDFVLPDRIADDLDGHSPCSGRGLAAGSITLIQPFGADVVAAVKAGKVTSFASPGVDTLGHLAAEQVALKAGIEMSHVPYNNQTLADVISGRVMLASTARAAAWGTSKARRCDRSE